MMYVCVCVGGGGGYYTYDKLNIHTSLFTNFF